MDINNNYMQNNQYQEIINHIEKRTQGTKIEHGSPNPWAMSTKQQAWYYYDPVIITWLQSIIPYSSIPPQEPTLHHNYETTPNPEPFYTSIKPLWGYNMSAQNLDKIGPKKKFGQCPEPQKNYEVCIVLSWSVTTN